MAHESNFIQCKVMKYSQSDLFTNEQDQQVSIHSTLQQEPSTKPPSWLHAEFNSSCQKINKWPTAGNKYHPH